MHILAADDERIALTLLTRAITEASPDAQLEAFQDPYELLARAKGADFDVAFLDIRMRGMDGLTLAKRLKDINPSVNIIFVTGYDEYAGSAFSLHASGYVIKPATRDKILAELENLRHPAGMSARGRLRVQCFGNFEAFVDGVPMRFRFSRTKELLAYLVDRRGAAVNTGELCAVLWEDTDIKSQKVQLRKLIADLTHTLEVSGLSQAFIKNRNSFAVNLSQLDCDYYRFLGGEPSAVNSYRSEYMSQYSWAEMTLGALEEEKI